MALALSRSLFRSSLQPSLHLRTTAAAAVGASRNFSTEGGTSIAQPAADVVKGRAGGLVPRLGMVLGSGIGGVADSIDSDIAARSMIMITVLRKPARAASPD